MTIKLQKLVLHFLRMLEQRFERRVSGEIDPSLLGYLDREDLIDIVLWLYANYRREMLSGKSNEELLDLIGDDACVLSYLVYTLNEKMMAVPQLTQREVDRLFGELQIDFNYLRHKPVGEWDAYDLNNYYALLSKRGKVKKAFAVFTSDVKEEDKYVVTTPPSRFFDTEEEAEAEIKDLVSIGQFSRGELVTYALWVLQ